METYSASQILQYAINCHYDPYDTEGIETSSLPIDIQRVEEYQLLEIPIQHLLTKQWSTDESKLQEYINSDLSTAPPIILGKRYKSGYTIIDGNHRALAYEAQGYTSIYAYVPIEQPKKLYHVSRNLGIIDEFEPRIPMEVANGEDETIGRICVSSSLEGCFSSAPWGGNMLEYTLYDEDADEVYREFRVYEFDTSNILSGDIVTPEELWYCNYVSDAIYKGEHWILESVPYTNTYVIAITDWEQESQDMLTYSDNLAIENGEDFSDVWDGECTTVITSVTYKILES